MSVESSKAACVESTKKEGPYHGPFDVEIVQATCDVQEGFAVVNVVITVRRIESEELQSVNVDIEGSPVTPVERATSPEQIGTDPDEFLHTYDASTFVTCGASYRVEADASYLVRRNALPVGVPCDPC